jgi:hypothetical protein
VVELYVSYVSSKADQASAADPHHSQGWRIAVDTVPDQGSVSGCRSRLRQT